MENDIKKKYRTVDVIITSIICIVVLGVPLTCSYIKGVQFQNKLLEKPIIVNGIVHSYSNYSKQTINIEYSFSINNEVINSSSSGSSQNDYYILTKIVIGKSFPVIVNKENPKKYNKILITSDDFREVNMSFPDSLSWVEKYISDQR